VLRLYLTSLIDLKNLSPTVFPCCRTKSLCLHDLSTLLWALAQLQLQPPEDILQDLCEATAPHLAACGATHLTNIVWALGRLQAKPEREWVEAAEAASLQVSGCKG